MRAPKRPPIRESDVLRPWRRCAECSPAVRRPVLGKALDLACAAPIAVLLFTAATGTHLWFTLSQQERAKKALEQLREAVASLSEGFALYDGAGRLALCNETYRQLCLEPPELLPRQHGLADSVERQLADGRWLLISRRSMCDGGSAELCIDITALKAAEAELRESREHLALAQRVAGVGSLERDLINGRGNTCTEEFCAIFGVDPDSFHPSIANMLDLVHPDDRPLVERIVEASDRTAIEASPHEFRIVRPDGTVRWVRRDHRFIRDENGRAVRKIVTYLDVTEVRTAHEHEAELQKQLLHSQRVEALGTLAGGVAHDLNNTLVPILATARLVLDDLPEDSPLREDLEMIALAGQQARNLVKQILAFSRKEETHKTEVDLTAVVRQTLQMLRATLPSTIEIAENIAAVPPILADAAQLQQIVVNLVTNAAQAIGDVPGTVTIILAPSCGSESLVRLSVADTGSGIEKEVIDRIFEPFFTTKEIGEGSGLGLSVVHGIVTSHGGRIEVSSVPGQGSVFTIALPEMVNVAGAAVAVEA